MLGYLDPGTGSVILQALVGGIAGFAVMVKMYGRRMFSWLPFVSSDTSTAEDAIDAAVAERDATDGDADALSAAADGD